MGKPLFSGVCTALVTPFHDLGINYDMMAKILDRQIDAGVRAVVIAGTTGESATLSDEEKCTLFRYCKTHVADRCLIIAGTGSNSTKHSVALSIEAEKSGADALLVVSPYYNKATKDGLIAHYCAVASSVHIPVIIYNVPSRTGLDIPVSVYGELSKIDNIVGVKEASSDITKIAKIRNTCDDTFSIWSGNDDQIVPVMALGGKGIISVVSNIKPATTVKLATAALSGDYKTASSLQCQLLPLIDTLFSEVNPIPVKAAMREIGYDCGKCRLPLCDMTEENLNNLRKFL